MEVNIGQFIQELRKEKHMTQKELADIVGVSDKTISKWEHGNSVPDTSILLLLCQTLDISVNELLSCKRLLNEEYSSEAEVNMVRLLKEKQEKGYRSTLLCFAGLVLAIISFGFWYLINFGVDSGMIKHFIDIPSLLFLLLVCVAVVLVSGVRTALGTLKLIQKTLIPTGIFGFLVTLLLIMIKIDSLNLLGPNLAVAIVVLLYAVFGYLILIPIISRLE